MLGSFHEFGAAQVAPPLMIGEAVRQLVNNETIIRKSTTLAALYLGVVA